MPDPAFDNFNHLALEVPTKEDVDAWRRWLNDHNIEVELVDHHIIYSIYFHDPNGVRLEITTTIVPTWNQDEKGAEAALDEWVKTRARARESGEDVDTNLRALITKNAHQAQLRRMRNGRGA
jgi:catechol-2,3-dioxygenase